MESGWSRHSGTCRVLVALDPRALRQQRLQFRQRGRLGSFPHHQDKDQTHGAVQSTNCRPPLHCTSSDKVHWPGTLAWPSQRLLISQATSCSALPWDGPQQAGRHFRYSTAVTLLLPSGPGRSTVIRDSQGPPVQHSCLTVKRPDCFTHGPPALLLPTGQGLLTWDPSHPLLGPLGWWQFCTYLGWSSQR